MKQLFLILLFAFSVPCLAQEKGTLDSELDRLNTKTALIIQSEAIDEYPLWSDDSDYIGCNIMGEWYKLRLIDIQLQEATWRNQTIGVLTTEDALSSMTKKEVKDFKKVSKFQPREVTTADGTKIELIMEGFSVSLVVTKKGQDPKTYWTSGGENCHSLTISPDEKYVAYLCEMTGLLVMKIK
jgi:hypothetical protein